MGVYDNLPYELQSPTWRNAGNQAGGSTGWNPSINSDWTARMLEASVNVARANANGVNTAQVDGSTNFLSRLGDFGGAVLASIGGQPEGAQVQQAGWGTPQRDPMMTFLMVGAVGVGIYFLVK